MAYTRIDWKNGEAGNTPLNANNLNRMDEAIAELDERAGDSEYNFDSLEARVTQAETNLNGKMNKNNPVGNGILTIDAINTQALTSMDVDTNDLEVSRISGKNGVIIATDDITVDGIPTPIGSLANTANTRSQEAETRANSAYNRASDAIGDAVIAMNRANENKAKIDLHAGLIGEGVGDKEPTLDYTDGYYIAPNGSVTQYNATAKLIMIDFLDFLFSGDNIIFNHVDLLPTENCIPCAWYDVSGNFISAADGLNVIAEIDEQTFKITKQYIDYCIIPVPAGASSCKMSGLANGIADIRIQTSLSEAIKDLQSKPETAPLVLTNPSPLPATDGKKILGIDAKGNSTQNGTPTPTSPIPIIDASEEVTAIGKNLFNPSYGYHSSSSGFVNNYQGAIGSGTDLIPCKSGDTYVFTMSEWSGAVIWVGYYNASKGFINRVAITNGATITIPSGASYFFVSVYASNITASSYPQIMLEKGTTATSYVPYASNSITLPYTLKSVGEVKDELIVNEDGSGQLVRRVGEAIITTVSAMVNADTENACMRYSITDSSLTDYSADYLCSHALPNSIKANDTLEGSYFYSNSIRIRKSDLRNRAQWETWLASNPITMYYPLEAPIFKDLTAEQVASIRQLQTYKGTTIIDSEMQIDSVTYSGDVKGYVDGKTDYSYTDQIIGKWADGKDLHRMVINATTPSAISTVKVLSNAINSNTHSIKRLDVLLTENANIIPVPFLFSTSLFGTVWVNANGINMLVSANDYINKPCEIVVEYTLKDSAPAAASVMSLGEETEE